MQAVQHYLDAGCYEEVVKYGPRGLETCIKMYGPNSDWSAAYAFFITEALYHLRRFDEALKQAQYAYSICLNLYGEKHWKTVTILQEIAQIYDLLDNPQEALKTREYNYPLMIVVYGEKHKDTKSALKFINSLKHRLGIETQKTGIFGLFKKNK